ncbi:hypothetical protein TNIN_13601 [Trichonephila inaurata madagascariensis]|uniref:Uncharacterized protein n=1 Tax=Trichonephila inaurata madagascariensis TaxID=2747483 RepID=A0A8X6IWQ3_9ARAC|nr:hypothetical protein TNIN_13601 [Trichonephila inaurata madagascariensis]
MEAQLRNEESALLIQGDRETRMIMQVIGKKHPCNCLPPEGNELYIETIGPLPIAPTRDKYILSDICMSPRYHESVPMIRISLYDSIHTSCGSVVANFRTRGSFLEIGALARQRPYL